MIRPIENSIRALEESLESLLISYQYDAKRKTLVAVLSYHEKAEGSDRAFLRLRFIDVSDFNRVSGTSAGLQRFKESYSTRETRASVVAQDIDIAKNGPSLRIRLSLGSFGGLTFVCRSISAESRSARAKQTSGSAWMYYDFDDGKPMDFHDPFA